MRLANRATCSAFLLLFQALCAGATEDCRPVPGLDPWIRPGAVILLGEIHGTAQSPAFVGAAACQAGRAGLPLIVALEQPVAGQSQLDAFLASDGGEAAVKALLAGRFWQHSYQDGRASQAMLELIERVGRMRRSGLAVRLALFDPGTAGGGQARDRGMAERLATLAAGETEAVTLVLTGNLHSRTEPGRPGNADYEPMGYLLKGRIEPGRVVSLDQAHGGGTAWICSRDCGVVQLGGRRGERPWRVEVDDNPPPGHDGWYRVGGITASPPARLSPAELAALVTDPPRPAGAGQPPPAETRPPVSSPTGPLSAGEQSMQGRWQGYDHHRGTRAWTLDVEGRSFRAEGSGEWYEGYLVVRADQRPAAVDFVIERCRCAYDGGATSQAVFSRQGDALMVAATTPGNPRPAGLQARGAQLLRFEPR